MTGGHPSDVPLTAEEKRAIAALKRLAKKWPRSLWLFAASHDLHVMRYKAADRRAVLPCGGMDPAYIVATLQGVPSDGGDW